MITQISAASPAPKFHSGKSYVKKISVHFLAICVNVPCKIEKFELEVVGVSILETRFCYQGSQDISYREIAAKTATPISFLSLISLKTVLL